VRVLDVLGTTEVTLRHAAATGHLIAAVCLLEGCLTPRALANDGRGETLLAARAFDCPRKEKGFHLLGLHRVISDFVALATNVLLPVESAQPESGKVKLREGRELPAKLNVAAVAFEDLVNLGGHVHDNHVVAEFASTKRMREVA
jgi:hypothetical protein